MSFAEHEIEDARLRILQTLNRQTDNRLGDRMVLYELQAWGINKAIEWVRAQMRELVELGAATAIIDNEAVTVIELTTLGQRHVERQRVIPGVRRPALGEK